MSATYINQEGLKSCNCYKIVLKEFSIVDSRFMHGKFAVTDSPEAPLVILKVIELLNSAYPVDDDVVPRHDPSSTLSFLN